ncbi:MAG: carboxypeptidase-like regulatory domain-containing protein [Limisphaerales bacterium]
MILILAIISVYTNIFAQSRQVSGEVTDQNGALIAGATVVLRNKKTGLERVTQTDSQGQFRFVGLGEGEYELVVTAKGFRQVVISYQDQPQINVTLEIEPFEKVTTVYSGSRQEELRESLSTKVGLVLLVLGGMHFFNLFVFAKMRRRGLTQKQPPQLPPQAYGRAT